ncbi:aarF domain-containing protein kinase 1-like [Paramacrobiotus metropolitanus]|uniref:aarF domain-containing protein kinase 1-like n=1 Tax=Paramacrobiotus metropolitanus TaxID=2943436 RepID=UPI002445B9FC|nr:aarF domain-containing protein kinase 1-like [Paramacrobiotus metropolitanus]XP_055343435.1 aarF domain-containing protein kinase 1-like [Paramacrobiotus metropolitanus]
MWALGGRKIVPVLIGLGTAAGSLSLASGVDANEIGVVRIGRAGATAARIAIDYKWSLFGLTTEAPGYRELMNEIHLRSALRLKELCCINKGAFIKVGQHVGSLDYLLPPEYVETMRSLFRDAPQSPFSDVLKVLQEDLQENPWEIFREIDENPLGAASLAQVHRAVLKEDGSVVAVKVQHPKVQKQAYMDIAAMEVLVKAAAKLFPEFQFVWLAEETKKILPLELDFLNEGRNCEKMGAKLRKFSFVKVPYIIWKYSTTRVLTMEFCEGGRVDDLAYYQRNGISPTEVYCDISRLFSEMIFKLGYVHCDPHPGNMLVNKTASGRPIISLLDHGVHLTIPEHIRLAYAKMWIAILNADIANMRVHAKELGVEEWFDLLACMLTARSWKGVSTGVQASSISPDELEAIKVKAGTILFGISDVLNKVPREVLLILKTNDLLRGLAYKLQVSNSPCSFTNTSLACSKVVFKQKLKQSRSWWEYLSAGVQMIFTLCRIRCYQLYLKYFAPPSPLIM